MNNLVKVFLSCMILCVLSCSYLGGYTVLGAGYLLVKEGKKGMVVYCPNKKYRNGGYVIIEENVKHINYNKSHVIIMTSDYKNQTDEIKTFWIIDKSVPINLVGIKERRLNNYSTINLFNQAKPVTSYDSLVAIETVNQYKINSCLKAGLIGPLDSLEFHNQLKSMGIDLDFK